jgi:hypothetical protein
MTPKSEVLDKPIRFDQFMAHGIAEDALAPQGFQPFAGIGGLKKPVV